MAAVAVAGVVVDVTKKFKFNITWIFLDFLLLLNLVVLYFCDPTRNRAENAKSRCTRLFLFTILMLALSLLRTLIVLLLLPLQAKNKTISTQKRRNQNVEHDLYDLAIRAVS